MVDRASRDIKVYQNKICMAGDCFQTHFQKSMVKLVAALLHNSNAAVEEFQVIQAGECPGLGNTVNREWIAHFAKHADNAFVRDGVAHARSGQPHDLRKGAGDDEVGTVSYT